MLKLFRLELMKTKRSFIFPILLLPPLLVVFSGVASMSTYLKDNVQHAWESMFLQSALLFAFYLLPLGMTVVCVLLSQREIQNNGILKMLALPVSRGKFATAKYLVFVWYLVLEILIFFLSFLIAGAVAVHNAQVSQTLPAAYLLGLCAQMLIAMLPCLSFIWMITVLIEKPVASIGINLVLCIFGAIANGTPLRIIYPYCYTGMIISNAAHIGNNSLIESATHAGSFDAFLIPCAIIVFVVTFMITLRSFGKKETE
jgi:lantibiotic transport system permease protein